MQWEVYSVHCEAYNVHCEVHSVHCEAYSAHFEVYSVLESEGISHPIPLLPSQVYSVHKCIVYNQSVKCIA